MPDIKKALPLAVGLVVGAIGSIMFLQSMPPPAGSPEERIEELERKLKQSGDRVAALEALDPHGSRRPGRTLRDNVRSIADDLRDGKAVTPDDIFRATQPLIRDLAPVFNRIRVKELQQQSDTMAGEMARRYSLSPTQQAALKTWLHQKAEAESKRYFDIVQQQGATLEDLSKASNDIRLDDGLENFMSGILPADKLATFNQDRMNEKVESVQREADRKVEQISGVVELDEDQRGRLFGLMARGARDFDPAMSFEGMGTENAPYSNTESKTAAIMSVLRSDQQEKLREDLEVRREHARQELGEIGLSLPENWDPFENWHQ